MKPEEREAIDRANAKNANGNGNGKKAAGSTQEAGAKKSVNSKTGAQKIQEQLKPIQEAVADHTIKIALSGVPLGLQRLASGDFGEAGEEMEDMISGFTGALNSLTTNASFQLTAGDDDDDGEPKKMLSAGDPDVVNVATVAS